MKSFLETKNWLKKTIVNSLFPIRCVMCMKSGDSICNSCEKRLERNTNTLPPKTIAKYNYKHLTTKNILFKLKYKHHRDLSVKLGEHNINFLKENIIEKYNLENYILVPVPLSKHRLHERGYNQAEMIAIGLHKNLTLNILNRVKNTHKLKDSESIEERRNLLKNGFELDKHKLYEFLDAKDLRLEKLNIILVDDITTSGATFYECKNTLIKNGISENNIYCFAVAH